MNRPSQSRRRLCTRRAALIYLLAPLAACVEITTPRERATDHFGEWTGPNVALTIRPGQIVYRKGGSAYIQDSFRGLSGNDIIYGTKKNRLRVSVPPHRDGAVWKMTVDGVEVQRPASDGPASGAIN